MPLVVTSGTGFVGCQRKLETAQVRGKVIYKDGSVPQAPVRAVRFEPTATSSAKVRKAASGEIQDDGSFELCTRKPGDGVYLGEYAVTFSIYKSTLDPIPVIAQKYWTASTTPYKVTVDGDRDDFVFEIEPIE
jgi:hypothetical protein